MVEHEETEEVLNKLREELKVEVHAHEETRSMLRAAWDTNTCIADERMEYAKVQDSLHKKDQEWKLEQQTHEETRTALQTCNVEKKLADLVHKTLKEEIQDFQLGHQAASQELVVTQSSLAEERTLRKILEEDLQDMRRKLEAKEAMRLHACNGENVNDVIVFGTGMQVSVNEQSAAMGADQLTLPMISQISCNHEGGKDGGLMPEFTGEVRKASLTDRPMRHAPILPPVGTASSTTVRPNSRSLHLWRELSNRRRNRHLTGAVEFRSLAPVV